MSRLSIFASLILTFLGSVAVLAAETGRVDYARQIKPILSKRCYACHGGLRQKAGLRLDTASLVRKGGKGGEVVEAGHGEDSALYERITATDSSRMPPEGEGERLPDEEATLLKRWIDEGAEGPADEKPEADSRSHWSFQVPVKSAVPNVRAKWIRNPVDAFIAAEHEKRGLVAEPEADRATLLRRVTIDLIGVPPTREELAAFLADSSPNAYEKTVDQLLRRPEYAERWGRHWMDLWRYSDWYGRRDTGQHRNSRVHIWRWRDWIVESVAKDKPYDRMILEMIAGDELAPDDPDAQRATGYLGRSFYVYNRNVWLQDTIESLSSSFLGLTMKCARCHDHKYDPIAQEDYYRLRAVFEPHDVRVDRIPGKPETIKVSNSAGSGQIEILKDGYERIYDRAQDTPTYIFLKGDEKSPIKTRPVAAGPPKFLTKTSVEIQPVPLSTTSVYPDLAPALVAESREGLLKKLAQAQAELLKSNSKNHDRSVLAAEKGYAARLAELNSFEARLAADRAEFVDRNRTPKELEELAIRAGTAERLAIHLASEETLLKAETTQASAKTKHEAQPTDTTKMALAKADQVVATARASVETAKTGLADRSPKYTRLGEHYPKTSTGRRLALARWMTSRENPLTARVMVNHIWLRHFGSPLVPTVSNLGSSGKPPSHPALLDWLAVEFMERGWSTRELHRLLVTSGAYRMRSSPASTSDPNLTIDRDNVYLWRMNPRRLEAEALRDSVLHLTGGFDHTPGGLDVDPLLADQVPRRSLYFRHTPDERPEMLVVFDAANPLECFRREESILPQQALAMANGTLARQRSRQLARDLEARTGTHNGGVTAGDADRAFVTEAFRQVLGREPTEREFTRSLSFITEQADLLAKSGGTVATTTAPRSDKAPLSNKPLPTADAARSRARENLVHVLFNHNDFITIR